jgi:phospholipid/cholesterol/gamma-HCH transport system ATP-binding protein
MRQMIGLETPDKGQVIIDGQDLINMTQKERIEFLKKVGVMFQSSGLFASMTIAENLELPLKAYTELTDEEIQKIIEIKLEAVGLSGTEALLPSELSGGMRKRAGIARAMVLDPDILFFDEPCSGLDPVTAASIDKLIVELNAGLGTTIVIVSHDLQSITTVSHRIIMLDKNLKGIIAEGTLKYIIFLIDYLKINI